MWERKELSKRDRSLITVMALIALNRRPHRLLIGRSYTALRLTLGYLLCSEFPPHSYQPSASLSLVLRHINSPSPVPT